MKDTSPETMVDVVKHPKGLMDLVNRCIVVQQNDTLTQTFWSLSIVFFCLSSNSALDHATRAVASQKVFAVSLIIEFRFYVWVSKDASRS